MRVLAVVTSRPEGLWLSELTHPYWHLTEREIEVDVFSPEGGAVSFTPYSDPYSSTSTDKNDLVSKGFLNDPALVHRLKNTRPLGSATDEGYDAIHIAGGMGATFDLYPNEALGRLIETFWRNGKVVGALCHGAIALANARVSEQSDAPSIVKGRRVTGFSVLEDENLQTQRHSKEQLVPHYPQRVLEQVGGLYESGGIQASHVVQDGKLLSGQNQQSATDYGVRLRDMVLRLGETV